MREIKFRLRIDNKIVGYEKWYGGERETEEKRTSALALWLYSKDGEYFGPGYIYHNKKDQFTGLKDKNGVEIYEGDIIKIDSEEKYEKKNGWPEDRRYSISEIVYDVDHFGAFYQWNKQKKPIGCFYLGVENKNCEVIGNIYENPEFLK